MNRDGDPVQRGGAFGTGGFIGREPSTLWYCGQQKNECQCGNCDGRCGPNNGCPCNACFELASTATNDDGDPVQRGGASGTGGFTGRKPSTLWYCGQQKNECQCDNCDGRCGPTNGCPCNACFELYLFYQDLEGDHSSSDSSDTDSTCSADPETEAAESQGHVSVHRVSWSCSVCTLINTDSDTCCAVCGTSRAAPPSTNAVNETDCAGSHPITAALESPAVGGVDDNSEAECCVCLSAPNSHVCVPCGHKCLCGDCQAAIGATGECPICKSKITMVMKVYG